MTMTPIYRDTAVRVLTEDYGFDVETARAFIDHIHRIADAAEATAWERAGNEIASSLDRDPDNFRLTPILQSHGLGG